MIGSCIYKVQPFWVKKRVVQNPANLSVENSSSNEKTPKNPKVKPQKNLCSIKMFAVASRTHTRTRTCNPTFKIYHHLPEEIIKDIKRELALVVWFSKQINKGRIG